MTMTMSMTMIVTMSVLQQQLEAELDHLCGGLFSSGKDVLEGFLYRKVHGWTSDFKTRF